jgi:DNA-binding CsgD family transcriptional regulator
MSKSMVRATDASTEWNEKIAKVLAAYDDEERLSRALIDACRSITSEEPGTARYITDPWVIAESPDSSVVPGYLRDLLPLDPLHTAIVSGQCGVMSLRATMPNSFEKTGYFAHVYGNNDITDELIHVVPLPDDRKMIINLVRKTESGNFRSAELDAHRAAHPVIAEASRRLDTLSSNSHDSTASSGEFNRRADIEATINEFGSDVLTPREREVIGLVLRGHNSESIAASLGIAIYTVKMHRKNSYAKLRLNSQGDLFNRLLETLGARPIPHRGSK